MVIANPRKDSAPCKNSQLSASLHFQPSDYIKSLTKRTMLEQTKRLRKRCLKFDAVTSIFLKAPGYPLSAGSSRRTTVKATSARRHEHKVATVQQLEEMFMVDDHITDARTPSRT